MPSLPLTHVLVVDDDENTRQLIQHQLRKIGVRNISFAPDGKIAYEMIRNGRFDVVLTDKSMPGMDGRELIRTVRADSDPDIKHLKMAMVSGELTCADGILPEEISLMAFLGRHYVLPIPKDSLSPEVLRHALRLLVGD